MAQQPDNSPPPASPETIRDLSTVVYEESEEGMSKFSPCAICQDVFEQGVELTELPCKHIFHIPCIEYWLKMNGTCPVLNNPINL
jgi:E3 ubiquitin-protein ligase RNF115/126